MEELSASQRVSQQNRLLSLLSAGALLIASLAFLFLSPDGILGKADAIGYAVCHRIEARSFHLVERPLPLCARCTGTFLGAFAGAVFLGLRGRGRSAAWPPPFVAGLLAFAVVPWALDGLNSYLTLFRFFPSAYLPQNWLRLLTGLFLGLAIAALFLPAVNQSIWKHPDTTPVLRGFRDLAVYLLICPILFTAVLTENPILLYPLAIFSVFGVLFLLTGIFTSLLLMLFRREACAERWRDAIPALFTAATLALMQILVIDWIRFALTKSWEGFSIPG